MTSTPVKDAGFGLGGLMGASGAQSRASGNFQAVWNNQKPDGKAPDLQRENTRTVKKTPGDSLKARDEHRARTEKREPSRDVEERTDISEEELEKAAETLGTAAMEIIDQVAETFDMTVEEVQEIMGELGMEQLDALDTGRLGELIMAVTGEEDMASLLTDEELYGSYKELVQQLTQVMESAAGELDVEPEQLQEISAQLQKQKVDDVPQLQEFQVEERGGVTALSEPVMEVSAEKTEKPRFRETDDNAEEPVEMPGMDAAEDRTIVEKADNEGAASRREDRDSKKSGDHADRGEAPNFFTQTPGAERFEAQIQQTAGTESPWDTDTQNIMRQIMDYMKLNLKGDMSSMEMQLHPASLGTLQIQIASKGGVVTANFIAQNEAVKAALETQMATLQERFAEQGVKVEAIEVTVQTHQFEQNLEQGRGGANQGREPSRRGRVRRLNIDDVPTGEEMAEEDRLARNLMEQNGNTVDYTA